MFLKRRAETDNIMEKHKYIGIPTCVFILLDFFPCLKNIFYISGKNGILSIF